MSNTPTPSTSSRSTASRFVWSLDTKLGLATMFAVGLAIRLTIAPRIGFYVDLREFFQTWVGEIHRVGLRHFYATDTRADYPPGYMYVLWALSKVSASPGYLLLKLPAIVCDLGLAWISGLLAMRLAPSSLLQRVPVRAIVVAVVLFNPAGIALSSVWGQVDVVPTMFVAWSLLLFLTGQQTLRREISAMLLFAVALSMKPQAAFALPVILYALYRRYLHRRAGMDLVDGALSIGLIGAPSLVLWAVSGLPFGLGPVKLIHFYSKAAGEHPYTSDNAFNLWGVIGSWRNDLTGSDVLKVAGIPALHFGILLFVVSILVLLWLLHRAIERGTQEAGALLLGAALASLLGFTLLTRMHERYMFTALALFAPLIMTRAFRWVYAALSALFLLNLWFAFTLYNTQDNVQALKLEPVYGWLFGGFAFDTWQKRAISAVITLIALGVTWRGFHWLRREKRVTQTIEAPVDDESERETVPAADPWGWARWLVDSARDETAEEESKGWGAARWAPLSLVGLACAFGLWVLRGETTPADNLNDSSFHLQMVDWAAKQIHEGRVPLDGWFPDLSIGSSFFHHYQSLSEILTAYIAIALGASDQSTFLWILYLLLALWPISVYFSARLLDWSRWTAAAAAAVSPLLVSTPGYGYEHGSYTWQGYGVYSQLWAMWLLPLAWGFTWRAVSRGKYYAGAGIALAATIACHFITGYIGILTLGVWVVVAGAGFYRRVGRAAIVGGGTLLIASWVLVPLIADEKWATVSEYYVGTIYNDSYGAKKILGWLFTDQLFDANRFPIITILFFVGVLACLIRIREDIRARAILGAFLLSLLIFFGRPTWGRLLNLLPGFKSVQIHRFIMGVDLAAIVIAGVGLAWILRASSKKVAGLVPARFGAALGGAVAVAIAVGVLAPAWTERKAYDQKGAVYIRSQQVSDATAGADLDKLVAIVKQRDDGRVYAGLRGNWGQQYRIGSVPVHVWLVDHDVDEIGFVFRTLNSLSTDVEVAFDETNPAQYQMLNIRYMILPEGHPPPVPATLLATSGSNMLYEVKTSGYFQVVDRSAAISENNTDVEQQSRAFRNSDLASQNVYPGVAFAGGPAPPPTFSGATPPAGSPGDVITQSQSLFDHGAATATVQANRTAVVLLKATYDPRWTATVDGVPTPTSMMAPSLVGVEVPPGRHTVVFRYKPYPDYAELIVVGALALLVLILIPHIGPLRRRGPEDGTLAPMDDEPRQSSVVPRALDYTRGPEEPGPQVRRLGLRMLIDLRRVPLVAQLGRFSIVGVSNTVISFLFYLGLEAVHVPSPLAAAVGFAAGALNGYWWNTRWTFADAGRRRSLLRYCAVQGAGAGTSALIVYAGTSGGLASNAAFVVAVIFVTGTTFIANRAWSFAEVAVPSPVDSPLEA